MKKTLYILKLKYAVYLNKQAFTLVEMLFGFAVFMMIIFFISPIFLVMHNCCQIQDRIQAMEWDLFCSQMKKEVRMSTKIQVTGNTLVLTEDAGTVVYEQYGNALRRRLNYSGHEILLQHVSRVTFTLLKNSVRVTAADENGKNYTFSAFSLLDWNGVL